MRRAFFLAALLLLTAAGQAWPQGINVRDTTVRGRTIQPDDLIIGINTSTQVVGAAATKADLLSELITTIFRNPPTGLTSTEQEAILEAIAANDVIVNVAGTQTAYDAIPKNDQAVRFIVVTGNFTANSVAYRTGDLLVISTNTGAVVRLIEGDRQLPALPAAGSRDNKVAKFSGDTLAWEEDATGGAGGGGITIDQARDTAGALMATLSLFGYNSGTNAITLVNNTLTPSTAQADTEAQKTLWRNRLNASRKAGVTTTTANTVIPSTADDQTYALTGTSAGRFTLPDIGTIKPGWEVVLINASTAVLTVAADTGETINGNPERDVPAGEAIKLQVMSNTDWRIIGDTEQGSGGGGTTVASDQSLTGTGASDDVLRVAAPLPAYPASGSRTGLVPKFSGDILTWQSDATGGGSGGTGDTTIGTAFTSGTSQWAAYPITEDIEADRYYRFFMRVGTTNRFMPTSAFKGSDYLNLAVTAAGNFAQGTTTNIMGVASPRPNADGVRTFFLARPSNSRQILVRTGDDQGHNIVRLDKLGAGGGPATATLTAAQQIALLTFIPDPAVIAFSAQSELEAAVRSARLQIPNPELLTGDVWYEGQMQGQPALTRTKWTSATSAITLSVNQAIGEAIASGISTDAQLEVRIHFYDAASAGNEIERIGVNIPLVDKRGRVNTLLAAVDGSDTNGVTTLTLPADYATYETLEMVWWSNADDSAVTVTFPTVFIAAQTGTRRLSSDGRWGGNHVAGEYVAATRVLTLEQNERILYAALKD